MHLICLHNVIPGPVDAFDEKCSRISIDEFEGFLDAVAARFDLISYSDYASRLQDGRITAHAVALSFDDGFLGVHDHAFPILARRGLDAIAFINPPVIGNPPGVLFHFLELEIAFRLTEKRAPAFELLGDQCDLSTERSRIRTMKRVKKLLKTRPEPDRALGHAEVLDRLLVTRDAIHAYACSNPKYHAMNTGQLRTLVAAGWAIGSHAMTHRTLSMLPADELAHEIEAARAWFSDTFGWTALPFAYPYGDAVHVGEAPPARVAAAGHPIAYTTQPGTSDLRTAPHRLPRVDYKRFLRDEAITLPEFA